MAVVSISGSLSKQQALANNLLTRPERQPMPTRLPLPGFWFMFFFRRQFEFRIATRLADSNGCPQWFLKADWNGFLRACQVFDAPCFSQGTFRALSEHFQSSFQSSFRPGFRTVSEYFFRAVLGHFQSSFRAVSEHFLEQFQSSFSAVFIALSEHFQSSFQSSFRVVSDQFLEQFWGTFRALSEHFQSSFNQPTDLL